MAESKILNGLSAVMKSWSGKSAPKDAYTTMVTFNIPANTAALILGVSGNGINSANANITAMSVASGTPAMASSGRTMGTGGSGNQSMGYMYIETGAEPCTVNIRQYGYTQAFTNANGSAIALVFRGGAVT